MNTFEFQPDIFQNGTTIWNIFSQKKRFSNHLGIFGKKVPYSLNICLIMQQLGQIPNGQSKFKKLAKVIELITSTQVESF